MPRIKEIPGVNFSKQSFGGYTYWRVWLGKKFTGGKPLQKRFSSYAEAARWVEGMRQGEKEHGKAIFTLSYDQLAEARAMFDRLAQFDVSLTAAVDHWIKFQAPLEAQRTFSELEKEFIASRKNHRMQGADACSVPLLHESNLRGVRIHQGS